ncbi:hypothetical protein Acr_23g0019300 [Actinidia rufa]|uniref:2-oxoglutarate (2OG) and Fe(II)-dependent oxygenase superfamily protein n=1 Tax=Actinidia rufa TaxID=165716 RepID=A0A7J0GRV4_9ERIC|nr:hypothetical protein Acr_23g0019300 [Actinidia rufa]
MDKLISNKGSTIQSAVPESYILPPDRRPSVVPPCKTIPVIDLQGLNQDPADLIQQIIKASQEYGFFQLTNHGVSEELMQDVLVVGKEFYDLPVKEKERFYSEDPNQNCRLKSSVNYDKEEVHFWRESFRHPCHPLEDYIHEWPQNPTRYREVFGSYSIEVRKLGLLLLDLICEGLGLEHGYFGGELSQGLLMSINHYPMCPDPSLVLGLPKHGDPYLLTLLNQGHVGWASSLERRTIISNGKLKSADHRVVPSSDVARTTVVTFINPFKDSLIEPAKSLVNKSSPPLYKSFRFIDFLRAYITDVTGEGKDPLERFMV